MKSSLPMIFTGLVLPILSTSVYGDEKGGISTPLGAEGNISTSDQGEGKENASNQLTAVSNTDLRFQAFDLNGGDRHDIWIDGAFMRNPKLKSIYELHHWDTDVTGSRSNGLESFHLKPIYFPFQGELG